MKYLIIGAGGTGGCIGGYLAKSGCDVTLIARGRHLEAIRNKGLTIERYADDFTVNINACTTEEYNDTPDVVFVCVKYYSLEEILPLLKRVCGSETIVIPTLNVFGTGAVLQEKLPGITVLDGCIYIYSFIKEPGTIALPSQDLIFRVQFGYRLGQKAVNSEKVLQAERDLKNAGIEASFEEMIEKAEILKFSMVSPMGACLLYYNEQARAIRVEGEIRDAYIELIGEIETLGKAMGIEFGEDIVERNLKIKSSMPDDSTTSMHRDILSGHPSEIDGQIHRIVKLADEYGLDLPMYRKISQWAKSKNIK